MRSPSRTGTASRRWPATGREERHVVTVTRLPCRARARSGSVRRADPGDSGRERERDVLGHPRHDPDAGAADRAVRRQHGVRRGPGHHRAPGHPRRGHGHPEPRQAAAEPGAARTACTRDIVVSHAHWDHIQGLPYFAPFFVKGNVLTVWGPKQGDVGMGDILQGADAAGGLPGAAGGAGGDARGAARGRRADPGPRVYRSRRCGCGTPR